MQISRLTLVLARVACALALAGAIVAAPLAAQEGGAPATLLPKGFDPPPAPEPAPSDGTVTAPPAETSGDATLPLTTRAAPMTPAVAEDAFAGVATGGPIERIGPLNETVTGPGAGYGPPLFTGSDGRFLAGVLRRMEAPLASRWGHIVLRRALLTAADAPLGINPADWIAERAWALLRSGEVDGARALIDPVPVDRYTRRLYLVAGQAALAAADLPGLCPIADTGASLSTDPLWRLAGAMCASMTGDDITAASSFDRLRSGQAVAPFDLMLAERIATVSGTGGRATNLDWSEVDALTPYRFGLATASGAPIPEAMLATLPGARHGWIWRAAQLPMEARAAALAPAAVQGIASAQEMVDFASMRSAGLDSSSFAATPAAKLRAAYAADSIADRLAGMRALWDAGDNDDAHYAGHIETALAAAAFPVDKRYRDDAPGLVSAMVSAGAVRAALRWWPVADDAGGDMRAQVWGLLAPVDPDRVVEVTPDRFDTWMSAAKGDKAVVKHRAALLLAGLQGLGKAQGSDWSGARRSVGLEPLANSWTRAIDAAAAAGHGGEVIVLAATALQGSWAAVPPAHFAHLIAALVRVGRGAEAGLIVAEAVTRA